MNRIRSFFKNLVADTRGITAAETVIVLFVLAGAAATAAGTLSTAYTGKATTTAGAINK
jgi:ribose/xylose/arabinose/galactoside ABC-type transport system permease subunit